MADKNKQKQPPVLRRGMSEPDWGASDAAPQPVKRHPFDWGIPRDLQPGAPPAEPRAEGSTRWARRLRLLVTGLVMIAGLLFIMRSSVQGFYATGVSMEPTLHAGDQVIVNRVAYPQIDFGLLDWAPIVDPGARWNEPDRGDIIVFKSPVEDKELLKRVIGLPGEYVVITDGRVYVDGKRLPEPYAAGETRCGGACNWRVPAGHYFVLGDNRENSLDSREGWTVPLASIDGEKLFAY